MVKMATEFSIPNQRGEKLHVVVAGNENAAATLLFVQGFGVSLQENSLFVDIVEAFQHKFTMISFDFAGYGQSEGKQENVSLDTESQDLDTVLRWVRKHFMGSISIIAHSLGCAVVSHLNPSGIEKTIFLAPTHQDSAHLVQQHQRRMTARGGTIDEQGISVYPHHTGEIQKIGASFWSTLRASDLLASCRKYSIKTNLLLLYPRKDEIIPKEGIMGYRKIATLTFKELPGDHNFSGKKEREKLFATLSTFFA